MLHLLRSHVKQVNNLRFFVLNKVNIVHNQQVHQLRQNVQQLFQRSHKRSLERIEFKSLAPTKIALGITTGGIIHLIYNNQILCKGKHVVPAQRMAGYRERGENVKFDWKKFWDYLQPHMWYFICAVFGALAVAILNIQIPHLMSKAINVIAEFGEMKNSAVFIEHMKTPAFKLVLMYVSQSLCTFFYINMLSKLGERLAYDMKTDLFASILRQDIAFFDSQRTGEIINRLTNDVHDFKSSFKQTVSGGLRAIAQIIGCSVSLFIISPQMTFVTLLCIPTVVAVGTIFGALLRNISSAAQAQVEKSTAVADEAVSNIRTVRAFAMEDLEQALFNNETAVSLELNERLGFGIGWFQAGTNMFLNGVVLGTVYMGGYLLSTSQLSPGDMMAFLMASQTIQRSLAQISLLFGAVIKGMAAGSRVFEYINMEPTMSLRGGEIIPDVCLKGNIEFSHVTFTYPTRSEQVVLKDFTLKIPAGKTVALVGPSGNGKTTVVNLLERFYEIKHGTISIDGYDIRTIDPSWLRQNVFGLISQEPILFGTTVMENIRYGRPDATDAEVKEAAHLANAHSFISSFPEGYHTLVGERGATLSGGQKQRIAIARALLKNPSVLLLDEATSALDTESEKIVQNALDTARKGRTVLVIAHRLSTIRNADLIVVLNKGHIIEMGTHEELLNKRGYYWTMVYQQQQQSPAG